MEILIHALPFRLGLWGELIKRWNEEKGRTGHSKQRNGRTQKQKAVWIHKDSVDRRYRSSSDDSIIFFDSNLQFLVTSTGCILVPE